MNNAINVRINTKTASGVLLFEDLRNEGILEEKDSPPFILAINPHTSKVFITIPIEDPRPIEEHLYGPSDYFKNFMYVKGLIIRASSPGF